MAGSPGLKIFDVNGVYQASCHEYEAAAALVAFYGEGAQIRCGHSTAWTLWTEGKESQQAAESYDHVANVAARRLKEIQAAVDARVTRRNQRHEERA